MEQKEEGEDGKASAIPIHCYICESAESTLVF